MPNTTHLFIEIVKFIVTSKYKPCFASDLNNKFVHLIFKEDKRIKSDLFSHTMALSLQQSQHN